MAEAPAFARRASSLAPMLRDAGARPGRPVIAITASSEALASAACAAFALKSPFFPLDPALPAALAASLIEQVGECLLIGEGQALSTQKILAAEAGPAEKFRPPPGPALLIATSGSSGRPKAVVLNGAALKFSALASAKITPLRPGESWLACLPLFHIGGFSILTRCAFAGAKACLHQGVDPERVFSALVDELHHPRLADADHAGATFGAGQSRAARAAPRAGRRRGPARRSGAPRRRGWLANPADLRHERNLCANRHTAQPSAGLAPRTGRRAPSTAWRSPSKATVA